MDIHALTHHIVTYAGFAAIVGVAILALLHFAQAREMARLRELVSEAPDFTKPGTPSSQISSVPQGVGAASSATQAASPKPLPRPLSQPLTQSPAAGSGEATSSEGQDTQLIGVASGQQETEAQDDALTTNAESHLAESDKLPEDEEILADTDAPITAAGIARPRPLPRKSGASYSGVQVGAGSDAAATLAKRTEHLRSEAAARRSTPSNAHRQRKIAAISAAGVLGVGVILLGTKIFGGDDSASTKGNKTEVANSSTTNAVSGGKSAQAKAPFKRGNITVAILNGTTIHGLAAERADQIKAAGFKQGTVDNAADQQRTNTTVYYASGQKRAAREVAKLLKVKDIVPLDNSTRTIAGQDAQVVVIIGTDSTE